MNTEDDYDEFTAALNAAMTTPPYAATPGEIEAVAAEEYHVRNGENWSLASDQARAEALQWASLLLISPAMQNVLRSSQAKALDEAAEDVYREMANSTPDDESSLDAYLAVEEWIEGRAQQIRNGKK